MTSLLVKHFIERPYQQWQVFVVRGTIKQVWTLVIRVDLIFEAIDGIEHGGECTVTVKNDGFIVGHVPIPSPGAIDIHRYHRQYASICTCEKRHAFWWYLASKQGRHQFEEIWYV